MTAATAVCSPLILVILTLVTVTGGGLAVASRWCPVLGIVGSAMVTGAGMAWICVDSQAHSWWYAGIGAVLFGLGSVNLRRVDELARRRQSEATRG